MTKKQKVRKAPKYRLRKLSFGEDKKKYFPRLYQRKALDEIMHGFMVNKVDRGQAILPCGAGKTAIALWAIEALQSKSTLMLCPSLFLVNQIYKFFAKNLPKNIQVLCVCSSKDDLGNGTDQWNPKEFIDDLNPTTDPKEIADFIKSPKQGMEKRRGKSGYMSRHQKFIIISTYQSSPRITESFSYLGKNFQFNLAICDEAHRTAGKIDKQATDIHFDAKIRCQRRLYMTATPKVSRSSDQDCASMSDASVYGKELTYMSFNDGIESGFLSDFQVQICGHEQADILLDQQDEQSAKIKIAEQFLGRNNCSHVVVFCQNIERAKFFADNIKLEGFEIFHINGDMPNKTEILQRFSASPKALITNARCLTEGVDIPNIDCVIFNDPKQSVVDIVQGIGRALRGGDKVSQVMIPLLQSDNELIDDLVVAKHYKSILNVVRAIMSHDQRIAENINAYVHANDAEALDRLRATIVFQNLPQLLEDGLIAHTLKRSSPFLPLGQALNFTHSLGFLSSETWEDYAYSRKPFPNLPEKPSNIPASPDAYYKRTGEWISWGHFLGYRNKYQKWMSYDEAKKFVHSLKLKSQQEWRNYIKGQILNLPAKPEDIPNAPEQTYGKKGDWVNWGDFLGYKNLHQNWLSYEDAKKFLRPLGLNSSDYKKWAKGEMPHLPAKPDDIPYDPTNVYKRTGDWIDFGDFLGYDLCRQDWLELHECPVFVHPLGLKSYKEWKDYCNGLMPHLPKKHKRIGKAPHLIYKNDWKEFGGWKAFLGYK